MLKVSIIKNGQVTHGAQFETQGELDAWLAKHVAQNTFGLAEQVLTEEILISEDIIESQSVLVSAAVTEVQTVVITPAVYGAEGDLIIPAVTEQQEVIITPAVYEQQDVIVQPAVYETQTTVIPAEYSIVIEDITAQIEAEANRVAKIQAGKIAREVCVNVLDLVAGYNLERELTLEQITQMQSSLSSVEAALRAGRPSLAKIAIQAITPDGVLVTQEMKDMCLDLLSNY